MPALVALSYLSLLVLGLIDNIRGPLFPEILQDMQLGGTNGSAFFAATSLFAFIGSWSSHALVERRSSLSLMRLSCLGLALGFALVALCHVYALMLAACAFFGWAFGALNLAQNLMVFEGSPAHLRRRFFSGLHSMYGLAALLAPLVATLFRSMGMDWRQIVLWLAGLPVLLVVTSAKMTHRPSAHSQTQGTMGAEEWRRCLVFSMMMAGYLWGEISVSTRLVLWLRTSENFAPDLANLYLTGFFVTLLAGRLVFSFFPIHGISNWAVLWISAGLSALLYGLTLSHHPAWILLAGLSMAPFFPVAMDQVSVLFPGKSAQALGFVLGFGSLSVVVMHLSIGWLTDQYGVGTALRIGPTTLLLIFMALTGLVVRQRSLQRAESKAL